MLSRAQISLLQLEAGSTAATPQIECRGGASRHQPWKTRYKMAKPDRVMNLGERFTLEPAA